MEPLNRRHVGDDIDSAVVSFVERLSYSDVQNIFRENNFWDLHLCPLYREVYYIVSLSRRVHYRRFHCSTEHKKSSTCMHSTLKLQLIEALFDLKTNEFYDVPCIYVIYICMHI